MIASKQSERPHVQRDGGGECSLHGRSGGSARTVGTPPRRTRGHSRLLVPHRTALLGGTVLVSTCLQSATQVRKSGRKQGYWRLESRMRPMRGVGRR